MTSQSNRGHTKSPQNDLYQVRVNEYCFDDDVNEYVALDGFDYFRDNFKYHKTQNRKKLSLYLNYSFFSWEEKS